jgi:hypothetical protein
VNYLISRDGLTTLLSKLRFRHLSICLLVFSPILLISLLAINRFDPIVYGDPADAYLFLSPPTYVAEEIGELFNITINISNVESLQSVEFSITYNTSLLNVAQVVQGPFFPSPPKSYFRFEDNESLGFVKVNISLVDSETARSGDGNLAWISFRVIKDPESCVSSPLDLQKTLLLNSALTPIAHNSVGAIYFWKSIMPDPPEEGLSLDLYTQKGGEGPNISGGEFIIGEVVYLTSRVTYNNDPVQQKLVAFEVRDPLNESVVFRTVITDQDGFAVMSFRTPDIPSSIGTWTVVSVGDIAGKAIWDTISFRVYSMMPVGGYSFSIKEYTTAEPLALYLALITILAIGFITIKRRTNRKTK